ncbi:MAG: hypothetical protein LBR94_06250 [Desulfovibrio sp.]|jgi:hypothetical protein|nr:hypothetical protein [Desulfovibrio sp.]
MAFETLDFYGALWQGQGIYWLLLPDEPDRPWFASPARRPRAVSSFTEPKPAGSPAREKQDHPQGSAGPVVWRPVPRNLWPVPWQERFAATRRGRLVWTYRELGLDMCRKPDARRRDLFQRLIADLAHPPGTHTFFPVCLPRACARDDPPAAAHNAAIFWSALGELGVRGVLVMGAEAVRILDLEEEMHLWSMARRHDFFVWRLPEADAVAEDERLYSTLLEFLRAALRDVGRHS